MLSTPDLLAQLTGSIMGGSCSPTFAEVHGRAGGEVQHPKAFSDSAADIIGLVRWTDRKDWLLTSAIGGDGDGRNVPLSVKNSQFSEAAVSARGVVVCTQIATAGL